MDRTRQRDHPLAQLARTLVVLVVCVAALAALAISHTGAPATATTSVGGRSSSLLGASPLTISTRTAAHIGCPSGASFTSDGLAFALLGSADDCALPDAANRSTQTQTLVIVDADYGLVTASISLDPLVLTRGFAPSAASEIRAIRYVGLGWSPDSQTFAVAFVAFDVPDRFALTDSLGSGLLLASRNGAPARVFRGDAGFFAAATASYAGLPIWDTTSGNVTPPIAAAPGLSYAWKSGAAPVALAPLDPRPLATLPTGAGPRYPVGRPSQDATFTIWQPGIVLGPLAAPSGSAQRPGDGAFVTNFTTWSPDGSHLTVLVAGISLPWPGNANASPPSAPERPQAQPLIQAPTTLMEAPPRDAALAAVEQSAGQSGWALVAWNPDGSLLASIQCLNSKPSLELRSTSTGALVGRASLHLDPSDPGCRAASFDQPLGAYANPNLKLLWSPDGAHILLSDQAANVLTEWAVSNG
jgi:hypothetical protein